MKTKKILLVLTSVLISNCYLFAQDTYKYGNTYKIKVPDYMIKMDLGNEDASMQYGNIFKEMYFLVIDESKKEFVDMLKSFDIYDEYDSPLNQYRFVQIERLKESMTYHQENKPLIFDAGGRTGQYVEITGKLNDPELNGIELFYILGFVEGKDKLYVIMTWTLKENAYKYKSKLIDIIKSFREI